MKLPLNIVVFVLFLFISSVIVDAEGDQIGSVVPSPSDIGGHGGIGAGYSVTINNESSATATTDGFDGMTTFWNLPLWIQIAFIAGILAGSIATILGALKLIPFPIGKIVNILEQRTREKIYTYVKNNPGCIAPEISRSENLDEGNVKYHIGILERSKKITSFRLGKFIRLFDRSSNYPNMKKTVVSYIRSRTGKLILQAILEHPGISVSQLSRTVGIQESTTHWYIDKMLHDDIIRSEKEGKLKKLYLLDGVKQIIVEYRFQPLIDPDMEA
ncbi:MAG TPA: winged helix-turn-helix transcriptional regulator [Methanocella sp.]|nr:winged helix-turn-helix transcriptional regulator [Methanocella sp.]